MNLAIIGAGWAGLAAAIAATQAGHQTTVEGADRIAVLHEGRIAEIGTHAELLRNSRLYAVLYGAFEADTH